MGKKQLRKSVLILGIAALMFAFSTPASATSFSFNQNTGFITDTLRSTDPIDNTNDIQWYNNGSTPAPLAGDYNTIAWGVPNDDEGLMGSDPFGNINFSAMRVIGYASDIATSVSGGWGDWVDISSVYHQNNGLPAVTESLDFAQIRSLLTIGDYLSPNTVDLTFNETLNRGDCPEENPNGSTCDDLFTLLTFSFETEIGLLDNDYPEELYEVEYRIDPLSLVNCALAVDFGTGEITVWTAERVTSSLEVQARIRRVPVPEPATLSLLGLGLLGLGLAARRKK